MKPRPLCCGQLLRRHRRSSTAQKSGAATAVIRGATAVGMTAPGMAAAMVVAVVTVGVATPTTTAEEPAAAEAEEARLVEGITREAVRGLDEVVGEVATTLGEVAVNNGTARGVVPQVTVPLQLVLGFKLGPRRGHCGDQKKASDSFLGGCCIFRRETEQTYCDRRRRHACVLAFRSRPYCRDRYHRCCC